MVDGIKLSVFNQAQEMGKFKGNRSSRLERCFQAGREVFDIRDVGIDVVTDDQVGLFSLVAELSRKR